VTQLSERLDRPVVLVGLMGVGKSTVGRRLAKRLGLPFVDSDAEIEGAQGQAWFRVKRNFQICEGERRPTATDVVMGIPRGRGPARARPG